MISKESRLRRGTESSIRTQRVPGDSALGELPTLKGIGQGANGVGTRKLAYRSHHVPDKLAPIDAYILI